MRYRDPDTGPEFERDWDRRAEAIRKQTAEGTEPMTVGRLLTMIRKARSEPELTDEQRSEAAQQRLERFWDRVNRAVDRDLAIEESYRRRRRRMDAEADRG